MVYNENDENIDSFLKENNYRIPLSQEEQRALISFLNTLTDNEFLNLQ